MSPESVLPHTSTNSLLILDGAEDGSPFQQIFGEVMQPQDEKEQEVAFTTNHVAERAGIDPA